MDWLPYPENLPDQCGEYLVTILTIDGSVYVDLVRFETSYRYHTEDFTKFYAPAWVDYEYGGTYNNVIAYMDIPMPFNKEEI